MVRQTPSRRPSSVDGRLVEQARRSTDGLERLIAAIWPEAYRLSFAILRDHEAAQDVAQDACVTIALRLRSLKHNDAFHAWSRTIIVNRALSTARRRPRLQPLDVEIDWGVSADSTDALDLWNAVAKLPTVQRAAILLHYYAGCSSREIAGACGWPSSTVRYHLMLARRALRSILEGSSCTAPDPSREVFSGAP
jgi:RNA polymerase sigma-70 factor, ECF subfamily